MDVAAHRGNGRRLEGRFMDGYGLRERLLAGPSSVSGCVSGSLELFG